MNSRCSTFSMPVPHARVGSALMFLLCRYWNRGMWPLRSWVMDEMECLFLRFDSAFRCCLGCGWCPRRLMSCCVYCLIEVFSAHSVTAAQKLVNVGLSVRCFWRGFFAALVPRFSASLLPSTPLWPGHHQSVIFYLGFKCFISLSIFVASILWVKALKEVFSVDISLTTP